jgi:hypothetical protein
MFLLCFVERTFKRVSIWICYLGFTCSFNKITCWSFFLLMIERVRRRRRRRKKKKRLIDE